MFNPTLYQILISSTESDGVKTAVTALCALLCIALPYLLGSVNFALVISNAFTETISESTAAETPA